MNTPNSINPKQKLFTQQEYWEKYYSAQKPDVKRINKIVGEYDLYWQKLIDSCDHKPESIIEIGAYPGRYLAYLSKKYSLKPTALDYNSDTSKIEECFASFGIEDFELIQADFLNHTTNQKYDIVISNGFVEHFEDFNTVMDLHCKYLSPGGTMLIMIPNKRFLRKYYSYLVDLDNLKIHNLKVMNLEIFRSFAARNSLNIEFLNYYGGFNFNVHQKLNFFQKLIHRSFRFTFKKINPFLAKNPSPYYSSTIIGIFTFKSRTDVV